MGFVSSVDDLIVTRSVNGSHRLTFPFWNLLRIHMRHPLLVPRLPSILASRSFHTRHEPQSYSTCGSHSGRKDRGGVCRGTRDHSRHRIKVGLAFSLCFRIFFVRLRGCVEHLLDKIPLECLRRMW